MPVFQFVQSPDQTSSRVRARYSSVPAFPHVRHCSLIHLCPSLLKMATFLPYPSLPHSVQRGSQPPACCYHQNMCVARSCCYDHAEADKPTISFMPGRPNPSPSVQLPSLRSASHYQAVGQPCPDDIIDMTQLESDVNALQQEIQRMRQQNTDGEYCNHINLD